MAGRGRRRAKGIAENLDEDGDGKMAGVFVAKTTDTPAEKIPEDATGNCKTEIVKVQDIHSAIMPEPISATKTVALR